ncbi:hypothetical protein BC835DRAFT_1391750 [Cytidiella melzeri]|nr:hypothetical protein BC835DRAFT_1391750 [Cytidiella melzeri]
MFQRALLLFSVFAATDAFVHNVQVGDHNGDTIYTPAVTIAKPGDFVNFIFEQKNHTVTQSSFADPCTPLQAGFNSGFQPVAANVTSGFPVFTVPVLQKTPIWFYCAQGAGTNASHCGKGMVGAINPSVNATFDAFKAKALAIGASLSAVNSTTTPSVEHIVMVSDGNATLVYTPPTTYANPGDIVTFIFGPKNHSVTQSAFDTPCSPLANGFSSGFHPVAPGTAIGGEKFSITVKDTNPVWLHCEQGANTNASHCGKGMVAVINPTPEKTFDAFKANAIAVGVSLGATNATSSPVEHIVNVSDANATLVYTPPITYADPGDIVTFIFGPKNHSVTQSSFDVPCLPLAGGFSSGFRPIAPGTAIGGETFSINITDTKPIWLHCEQGANTNATHCGKGMVAAINPTPQNTFDAFKANAIAAGVAFGVTNTTTAPPVVHTVFVSDANATLVYTPPTTYAKIGETVTFVFGPKNHTVTQSSFATPCSPLANGFTSGFRPVAPDTAIGSEMFSITIADNNPIWLHCEQGANTNASHCGKGMVAAINPTQDKTFDAFHANALNAGISLGAIPSP